MPVALLNYLDRQMLASMKSSVMIDIPTIGTDENWGLMLGQFKWVYAVFSLVGGYLADRFSRRYVICASLVVWSAITWLTSFATTFHELLWTRSLMGISEAFYIPAALALIADYHTGDTRSRAVGLHQMAIYLGVILGGFGGYVADAPEFGWRFAFEACGMFGVLYSLPLCVLLRDKSDQLDSATDQSALGNLRELLTNFSFILLVLYFTLPALAGWVVRDWMPAILKETFQLAARPGWRGSYVVLANCRYGECCCRGMAGRSLDAWKSAWENLCERDRHGHDRTGNIWGRDRRFAGRCRWLFDPVRNRLGILRLQQHADFVANRSTPSARHRLWNHELRKH